MRALRGSDIAFFERDEEMLQNISKGTDVAKEQQRPCSPIYVDPQSMYLSTGRYNIRLSPKMLSALAEISSSIDFEKENAKECAEKIFSKHGVSTENTDKLFSKINGEHTLESLCTGGIDIYTQYEGNRQAYFHGVESITACNGELVIETGKKYTIMNYSDEQTKYFEDTKQRPECKINDKFFREQSTQANEQTQDVELV